MIAAKETIYNGYRFRSRLEARWAVFFDTLGIKYEYEAEGYVIDGTSYLPDFKLILPNEEIVFAEVKHAEVDDHRGPHVDLCRGLSRNTGKRVLLLPGAPTYRMYNQFIPNLQPDSFTAAFFQDYEPWINTADDYWFAKVVLNEETGALEFHGDERRMGNSFGRGLVAAVNAARQARFEWGETPVAPVRSQPVATTWRPGDKARHPTYGEGTVVAYASDEDKVTMAFLDPPRIKSFLAKRANLALIYRPS